MLTRGFCLVVCFCAVTMAKSQLFPFNLFSDYSTGAKAKQGAAFTFTHEGITPQEIITGCQGTKFANGEIHTEFYVIDLTGRKKFVYPGGSVEIVFPSRVAGRDQNPVAYNEMCFPKQCGVNTCGFVVGPVTAPDYAAKNPSNPVVLPSVPVSSAMTVEPSSADTEVALKQGPCVSTTTTTQSPCSTTTTTASPSPCSTTTTTTPSPSPCSTTTTTTPSPSPCATTTTTAAPLCPPATTTTTTTQSPCPTTTTTTQAPCQTTTTTAAPCPETTTTTTPVPCPPAVTPQVTPCSTTPAPCPGTKEGDDVPFLPARASYREPSDGSITDAAYYAKLPGAIRGHAGVIYYPSCERSAFQQVAIIPFCGSIPSSGKKARDLKDDEVNELQSKMLKDHSNEIKEESETHST